MYFLKQILVISHLLQVLIKHGIILTHHFQAGQHLGVIYAE